MKRKLIALLLVVVMVMAITPTAAFAHSGNHDVHDHDNIIDHIRARIEAGSGGTIYSPSSQAGVNLRHNRTWTFTTIPDDGYVFSHWTYNGNEVSGAFTENGGNLSVKFTEKGSWSFFGGTNWKEYKAQAVFIPDPTLYDVTLDLGAGGTFDSNGLSTIVISGLRFDTLNVPAFTENTGYDHIGWTDTLDFSSSRTIRSRYEYEVTFMGNAQITITSGSPAWTSNHNVSDPSYTVAPGYRFDGWDRSLSGITAPTTINAKPAVGRGTITLEHTSGGDIWFEGVVEGTYDNGTSVTLADSVPVANVGWGMRGWKVGDTDVIIPENSVVTVNGDEKYTAVFYDWERLRTRAGANGSLVNPVDTWKYGRGEEINLNTLSGPQPDYGYMFDKWIETDRWDNKQRDVALVGGEPIITIGDSNYFKALFRTAEYTVTFEDSQGETLGTETVLHGGDVTKIAADFTYDTGERPVGSGWDASEGQNITAPKTIVVNTEYEVTFDLDGGTRTGGGDIVQWVAYNGSATAPVFDPPAGAQFTGWDKTFANITQAETVTAKYEFLVEFVDDAGNVLASEYVANGGNATTTPGSITLGSGQRYKNSPAWDPALGQNITAQTSILVELEYEVTFDLDGGTRTGGGALSQWVAYGGSATAPVFDDPADANFVEWDTAFDNITDATHVTAVYEYLVEFVDDAGNVLASEYVKDGDDAVTVEGDITLAAGKRFKNSPAWNASLGQNITVPKDILVELEYNVIFDLDGGSRTGGGALSQWIPYNGSATAPDVDPPTDAQFTGWDKPLDYITEAQTFTAMYDYLVEFVDDAGNVLASEYVAQAGNTVTTEGSITLGSGQRFKNSPAWDAAVGQNITAPTTITVELEYEVTFDLGGGTRTGGGALIQWVAYGGSATAPVFDDPADANFVEWDTAFDNITDATHVTAVYEYLVEFVDDAGNVLASEYVKDGEDAVTVEGDITLGSKKRFKNSPAWDPALGQNITEPTTIIVPLKYRVRFRLFGGTRTGGGTLTQWIEYGGSATAPTFDPPTGKVFSSWNKAFNNITSPKVVKARYSWIDYTLTINFLDRVDNSDLVPAYVGTYHYTDLYSIISPAVLGYDLPSIDTVAGTMPADDVVVNVYYDTHAFKLTYMQHDGDLPTDLREYRIYHKDSVSDEYPVKVGYRLAGTLTIVEIGEIGFVNSEANRFTDPFLFNTTPIGIAPVGETCIIYWYDEDNAEWIQADTKAGSTLYQATFDANSGAFADTSIVKFDYAYVGGNIVSPDLPTKEGHTFIGWDVNGDGVIDASDDLNSDGFYDTADIDEITMSANITITAIYEINTFEVKFFDHDGTQIGTTKTVDWNTAATAPADPTREGHTFAGWDKAFDAVKADLDVTATYTINTFEVKFFDHDGTQIGATQTVDWNTAATAPADPTRDGHTFAGWDKAFDAVKADLDVTATYTINTFEVKFFDHDGTQIGATQTVDWNTAVTAPADPDRLGHTFAGWDKAFDAVTANLDVTATYTINSYTVTFVDHDGTVLKTQRVHWRGAATAPTDPTREGYEFKGWDKEFDRVVRYMTVTAVYDKLDDPEEPEEEGFLVQFFDDEGNLISEQRVEEGSAAEAPEPPAKEGYEFAGWDKEFDPITQNLVVTALYTKLDVPSTNIIEDEPSAEADLTDTTQGSFPWWWIVAGAGTIALLLLILFFVKRRKDQEEEA